MSTFESELLSCTTSNRIGVHNRIDASSDFSSTRLRSDTFKGIVTTINLLPLNQLLLLGGDSGLIALLCWDSSFLGIFRRITTPCYFEHSQVIHKCYVVSRWRYISNSCKFDSQLQDHIRNLSNFAVLLITRLIELISSGALCCRSVFSFFSNWNFHLHFSLWGWTQNFLWWRLWFFFRLCQFDEKIFRFIFYLR